MTAPKIEPALTAEEFPIISPDIVQTIRGLNAALPDSDPRKITREMVELVRDALPRDIDIDALAALRRLADALESYLPPEKP